MGGLVLLNKHQGSKTVIHYEKYVVSYLKGKPRHKSDNKDSSFVGGPSSLQTRITLQDTIYWSEDVTSLKKGNKLEQGSYTFRNVQV